MTGPDADAGLESPYWRVGDDNPGLRELLARLHRSARPMAALVRRAAPVAAPLILLAEIASGVASAFGLLATTNAFAAVLTGGPTNSRLAAALPSVLLVAGAATARGGLTTAVSLLSAGVGPSVRRLAEERLLAAGLAVPLSAYDDATFYDHLHRARDRGVQHLERALDEVVTLLGALSGVAAAAATLAILHPLLLLALIAGMIPQGWAVLRSARIGYTGLIRTVSLTRRVYMVLDLGTEREPAAEIRANQAEEFLLAEYRPVADRLRATEVGVGRSQVRARVTGQVAGAAGLVATIVVLVILLRTGWVPLAAAGTALLAIRVAGTALTQLVIAVNQLFEQALYITDYHEFTVEAAARARPSGGRPASAPQAITLHGVSFRYPDSARDAVHHIDLTIRSGTSIALVGENGSGKTTLAKLVAGLYPPSAGTIRWDGADLATLDPAEAAAQVVVVLQEPVRWPVDAEANIRVGRTGRPDPGNVRLHAAAARSGATDVIDGLPNGWRTMLSRQFRGGHELSGGQWQRLAVARGLYRDAPVLICDEPTAPLDPRAERAVYDSLREMATGRTLILITHRLASVRHADQIYLLHDGTITERGTHEELLALNGHYADLYHLQAETYTATTR